MQYLVLGEGPIDIIPATADLVARVLLNEGIDRISNLSISFDGWRGDSRCQIVDAKGFLAPVYVSQAPLPETGEIIEPKMPEGLTIRDRPEDLEWSPFAVMMGRDD